MRTAKERIMTIELLDKLQKRPELIEQLKLNIIDIDNKEEKWKEKR